MAGLRDRPAFDVAIVGAGVTGARIFRRLDDAGYRCLLLDRGDFSSGTSQSSGMMIWGGLLYLRQFDFAEVRRLSRARDALLADSRRWATPRPVLFVPDRSDRMSRLRVRAALSLYHLLGERRRTRPSFETDFEERSLLEPEWSGGAFRFEEGFLEGSDARFVLRWIFAPARSGSLALNHVGVSGTFDRAAKRWSLEVDDRLEGARFTVDARFVVNAAGAWADEVNETFGIVAPVRHLLSRGVYLVLRREPAHRSMVVFDLGENDDVVTWVPWGPVALWGPTETVEASPESGTTPERSDLDFLLRHHRARFRRALVRDDVVGIRTGVRALAVPLDARVSGHSLAISRRSLVLADREVPWISCFGGKLTSSGMVADDVAKIVVSSCGAASGVATRSASTSEPEMIDWPGMPDPVPRPAWSRAHEGCATLGDYLRRRTNISLWIPRRGLGAGDEWMTAVSRAAEELFPSAPRRAGLAVEEWTRGARQESELIDAAFDRERAGGTT